MTDPNTQLSTHNSPALHLAESVGHWHTVFEAQADKARSGFVGATQARLLAGAALVGLKRACKHGEFQALRDTHFASLPERTADRWKERAELDLRTPELRVAVEAVLRDRASTEAQTAFAVVSQAHFVARATLLKGAAEEMHLLPGPAPRKQLADRKPAPRLTPDQQIAKRREMAVLSFAECETQLAGCSTSFTVLDDFAVSAQVAALERHVSARKRWLATPAKKRDARAVDAVHAVLHPPAKGVTKLHRNK